jgi:thioredoxin 1
MAFDDDGGYDDERFWQRVASDDPTFLGFWTHRCTGCQVMAPVFSRLAKHYRRRIEFIAVNTYDRPDIARRFGVSSTPTFVLTRRGKALRRFVGNIPEQLLMQHLEPHAPPLAGGVDEDERPGLLSRLLGGIVGRN